MPPLPCQRDLFDIPADVVYLNCAYMSPLMKCAAAAARAATEAKMHPWTIKAGDFFTESERARSLSGRVIGASADHMAIVPAVSYGIATAARNLPVKPGQRIITLAEQFPANVYAWRRLAGECGAELVQLDRPADGDWTRAVHAAIDDRTALVAVPNCHWTDGSLIDVTAVGVRARAVGAGLVLDLAQSAGALPIDIRAVDPDFAVYPTYKWALGPYSLGFLYVADRWQETGVPLEETWTGRLGSEDFANLVNYQDRYQPGARRFDMGQRANLQLLPAATAALEQLLEWGISEVHSTLAARNMLIAERAEALGYVAAPEARRAGHYLGLRLPEGRATGALVDALAREQVVVSVRGSCVRVTPHLYNTDADVDRLFSVLEAF